jgi:hypothetical protein
MKTFIDNEESAEYGRLSEIARHIEESLSAFAVEIVQSKQLTDANKIGALNMLARADGFRGASYMLHPQSEWQGGEAWKVVRPDLSKVQ